MSKKRILLTISLVIVGLFVFLGFLGYRKIIKPFVKTKEQGALVYIPTGSSFVNVRDSLFNNGFINDSSLFRLVSDQLNYIEKIKPGRYKIENGWSVLKLVRHLRSGRQEPVKFTFNNIRFITKLAGIVGKKLEADSAKFMELVNNPDFLAKYGVDTENAKSIFLPNTYEFNWNTSEEAFIDKMYNEYERFWTESKKEKAKEIGLSSLEISVLASIIQEETNKKDEMSRMAGVLINRLRKDMLLQVDPTARYAYGNFDVKRIKSSYTKIDSPYNTYIYKGLPPGPICMANPSTIDMVLDFEENDYIFYCAKDDGSGYHSFAKTGAEHARNAAAYHRYLNKLNIYN